MYAGIRNAFYNKQLDLPSTKYKYGFLYNEYKNSEYYWEFVKIN